MSLETQQGAAVEVNSYEQYRSAGGFLDETDYASVLARAKNKKTVNSHSLTQAGLMASVAGIELQDRGAQIDLRVVLYDVLNDVLRTATNRNPQKYHYSQMDDQSLFAEALRMLGDTEALEKFQAAHPNIFPEGK